MKRNTFGTEEHFGAFGLVDEAGGRHAEQFDHAGQLIRFVLAGQERVAEVQLGQDAAQRPHVDRQSVAQAQDHFGRPVEARLDVRVHPVVLVAARTEIDNLFEEKEKEKKKKKKNR